MLRSVVFFVFVGLVMVKSSVSVRSPDERLILNFVRLVRFRFCIVRILMKNVLL